MNSSQPVTKKNLLILLLLLVFALVSFLLRITPVFSGNSDVLSFVATDDPPYHLRQVEQMLANYPAYNWFDPMTYYPNGQPMHWGPLFTLISATLCLLAGATTRLDIVSVCLLVPPLMGVLLVPITYLLVRKISDIKSGLIAAFFISFIPGQLFFRSFYGYFDHHIGEVLFSTLFCLSYIMTVVWCQTHTVSLKDRKTWNTPLVLGLISGIAYTLGLAMMPTMILFALIVGIFTPVWFILERISNKCGFSILLVNLSTFITSIIGFFVIGIHAESGGLNYYTIGHPFSYVLLILGTCVLYGLSLQFQKKGNGMFILSMAGLVILAVLFFALFLPVQYEYLIGNMSQFFGQDIHWKTIIEARQWTFEDAWRSYGYSLVLSAGGALALLHRIRKESNSACAFVLLWSVVMFYATSQHIRYEYYLAVPIVVLSGICIGSLINLVMASNSINVPPETVHGRAKHDHRTRKNESKPSAIRFFSIILLIGGLAFAGVFTYNSLLSDLSAGFIHMDDDWREAATWLGQHTPDPGIDYLKIYDQKSWTPPPESYGVMSWWDYGHMITYLGKRMPNANPFQYGVDGDYGSARFFLTTSEDLARGILDKLRSKYVMTDYKMDFPIFSSMALWNDTEKGDSLFISQLIFPNPDNPKNGTLIRVINENYYNTIVARLHSFDGSMMIPEKTRYVQYVKPEYTGLQYPLVIKGDEIPYAEAQNIPDQFNSTNNKENGLIFVGTSEFTIPVKIPALQHFRLIHESPTQVYSDNVLDIRAVKTFEYVPGARIQGEGVLEIPVRTNTGRVFFYRQESLNGSFILPYPTNATIGDITTGLYKNTVTGKEYTVTEDEVQKGER